MGIVTAKESRAEERAIYFPPHERAMAHYSWLSPDRHWVLIVEMNGATDWQRCRVVPMEGNSAGVQVGPQGACTAAAWSPDGRLDLPQRGGGRQYAPVAAAVGRARSAGKSGADHLWPHRRGGSGRGGGREIADRLGGRAAEFRLDPRCRGRSCGFAGRVGRSALAFARMASGCTICCGKSTSSDLRELWRRDLVIGQVRSGDHGPADRGL